MPRTLATALPSTSLYERMNAYLDARTGTYQFRCQRYDSVIEKLLQLGFKDGDLVVDVGAGRCEFSHRMYERGLRARYLPVDGSIDGTDMESWSPPHLQADFFVAIEVLEHLHEPFNLMVLMRNRARKAAIATTPNGELYDVLEMDPTHLRSLRADYFTDQGWRAEIRSHFGRPDDSVLAWWEIRR